jgi:hypothetical protein
MIPRILSSACSRVSRNSQNQKLKTILTRRELVDYWIQAKVGDAIKQKFAEKASLSKPMIRSIFHLIAQPEKGAFRVPESRYG